MWLEMVDKEAIQGTSTIRTSFSERATGRGDGNSGRLDAKTRLDCTWLMRFPGGLLAKDS
jgi:hypothetical protein